MPHILFTVLGQMIKQMIMREALRFHHISETTDALIEKLVSRMERWGIVEMSQLEVHALLSK
jgi:hypothetical protein